MQGGCGCKELMQDGSLAMTNSEVCGLWWGLWEPVHETEVPGATPACNTCTHTCTYNTRTHRLSLKQGKTRQVPSSVNRNTPGSNVGLAIEPQLYKMPALQKAAGRHTGLSVLVFFFFFNTSLLIYLPALGLSCSTQCLWLRLVGSSSLTRDHTPALCLGVAES